MGSSGPEVPLLGLGARPGPGGRVGHGAVLEVLPPGEAVLLLLLIYFLVKSAAIPFVAEDARKGLLPSCLRPLQTLSLTLCP